jgi:outer membrane protein insertion porin family
VKNVVAPLSGIADPDNPPLPPLLLDQQGLSHLNGTLVNFSYRNLDVLLNPREGYVGTWRNGVYGGPLGGDYQYWRSEVGFDYYHKLGDPEEDVQPSYHFRGAFGVGLPFGDTSDVPYTERFFLGGYSNMRGWEYRGVGPNTGDTANGGQTMLNASLEYRHPLYKVTQPGTYKEVEVFNLVIFTDWGVLDSDTWQIDPSEFRGSVGFGFGLSYPIPLTFNFGFPVLEGDGDQTQVFSFSLQSFFF